jgi:hypothetical protein
VKHTVDPTDSEEFNVGSTVPGGDDREGRQYRLEPITGSDSSVAERTFC